VKPEYSPRLRRRFIEANLQGRYGYNEDATKAKGGWSTRRIASDVAVHFEHKAPSPATILTDLRFLQERYEETRKRHASGVLDPEEFRQWRAHYFKDPNTGLAYETPDHQYHWFRAMIAFALKQEIPQETVDYLDLPEELNGQLLGKEHLLTLILLAPPRHGKTELAIHAIIWLICYNPNIRILYCSGVVGTSRDNADLMKMELEHNDGLVTDYGPFRNEDVKWNQKQFTVATRTRPSKSPTVLPIGLRSNVLSKDADLIVVDDPQDLDDAESETVTERDFRHFTTQLMSRREPHTPVLGLGSHLPSLYGDLWTQIEENAEQISTGRQVLVIRKIKAHDYNKCDPIDDPGHTLCILWPSLRPYWFLEGQRATIGDDVLYEAVYNQELLEGALRFFPKDTVRSLFIYPTETDVTPWPDLDMRLLAEKEETVGILDTARSWREIPFCCNTKDKLLVALGVDPGASESKRASESAFALGGACKHCQRRYLVDYAHERQSPELNPHTIVDFAKSYTELDRVRIEINAYQKSLARDKVVMDAQTTYRFLVEDWNTDERKNDAMIGIPVLSRWMKAGKWSIPYKTDMDREIAEYVLRQLVRWPKRPNDLVMAMWLMDLSLAQMVEDAQWNIPEYGENWANLPEHLKEQVYEVDTSEFDPDWG
jgi:hypothetical protein